MPELGGVPAPNPAFVSKTLTFTGSAGAGAIGSVAIATVTGLVEIVSIVARVTTSLTGATATIALGITGSTSLFIGATTATTMTTSAELWVSTTATAAGIAIPAACKNILIDANIIATVATAAVSGGVLEIDITWVARSAGASVT